MLKKETVYQIETLSNPEWFAKVPCKEPLRNWSLPGSNLAWWAICCLILSIFTRSAEVLELAPLQIFLPAKVCCSKNQIVFFCEAKSVLGWSLSKQYVYKLNIVWCKTSKSVVVVIYSRLVWSHVALGLLYFSLIWLECHCYIILYRILLCFYFMRSFKLNSVSISWLSPSKLPCRPNHCSTSLWS